MEAESLEILRRSVKRWAAAKLAPRSADLERYPLTGRFPPELFQELADLGVLDLRAGADDRLDLEALSEVVFVLAQCEPAVALLVLERNLAAALFAAARRPLPEGWIALPLYDHPSEWPRLLRGEEVRGAWRLWGEWRCLPALPIAARLLLPVFRSGGGCLLEIDLGRCTGRGVRVSGPILPLGLRGCPLADLALEGFAPQPEEVLLEGAALGPAIERAWACGEVAGMAIRSGILGSSFRTALEYAKQRYQGGAILVRHSLVRERLAGLELLDEHLRSLWRQLAREGGRPGSALVAASLESARLVPRATSEALQVLGGYGYMEDFGQEKRFRDAEQTTWLFGHPKQKRDSVFQGATERPPGREE